MVQILFFLQSLQQVVVVVQVIQLLLKLEVLVEVVRTP